MPIRQPRRSSILLSTGQTTEYGSGTGADDGFYEKGVVKSYTILTTGQYSGTVDVTINSKTDTKSNNCVLDNNTGLMWSRYASASVGAASDGLLEWTTTGSGGTAQGIFPYCAAANTALLAGYSDWRVPNVEEMGSVLSISGTLDATAFPSAPTGNAWTSTSAVSTPSANALFVTLNGNEWGRSLAKTTANRIFLVRG